MMKLAIMNTFDFKKHLSEQPIFGYVQQAADALGVEAYVVGGYVRDCLLGRSTQDVDFVCVGSGIELAKKTAALISPHLKVNVYKNFGTAMFHFDGWQVEFVGARKESYRSDSRKPIVEDGTLEDDQKRRDFTINALAVRVNQDHWGELIDPFDGLKDLKSGMIRTPLDPDITFSDDPLRMLRAIRFASQLRFDINAGTFEAIIRNKERIKILSQERITEELNKIILSPEPSYGFKLLFAAGLLEYILPELVALHGVEVIDGKGHKDNFYHTLKVLDNVAKVSDDLWLRWAALLHDIGKAPTKAFDPQVGWTFHGHEVVGAKMTRQIFRRLCLPNKEPLKKVETLVRLHLRPIALVKETVTDSAIRRLLFDAGEYLEDLMILCRADITSKDKSKVARFLSSFDKVEQKIMEVEERDRIRNFQPIVSGECIMYTFDLPPGRLIGEFKEAIKEAVLDGKIKNDFDQAFDLLLTLAKEKGLTPKKSKEEVKAWWQEQQALKQQEAAKRN
jgi:putative nucleotidyltransferase with HDIG domain